MREKEEGRELKESRKWAEEMIGRREEDTNAGIPLKRHSNTIIIRKYIALPPFAAVHVPITRTYDNFVCIFFFYL